MVGKRNRIAREVTLFYCLFFLFFSDSNLIAIKHLRTLLTLVLTNSEVRKLLYDFSVIGRDLLAISATKTAEKIAPHDEELRSVNDTAPHDQFITQGGRVAQPGETPVFDSNGVEQKKQQALPEGDVVQSKGKILDTLKQFRVGLFFLFLNFQLTYFAV